MTHDRNKRAENFSLARLQNFKKEEIPSADLIICHNAKVSFIVRLKILYWSGPIVCLCKGTDLGFF